MGCIDRIDHSEHLVMLAFHYADEIKGFSKLQKIIYLLQKESMLFNEYIDRRMFKFSNSRVGPICVDLYFDVEFHINMDRVETVDIEKDPLDHRELMYFYKYTILFDIIDKYDNKSLKTNGDGKKLGKELEQLVDDKYLIDFKRLVQEYNSMSLREILNYIGSRYL